MRLILAVFACFAAALCAEETRHISFGAPRRPSYYNYYYYRYPSYRPSSRTYFLDSACCSNANLVTAGCKPYVSAYGYSYCRCCINLYNNYALMAYSTGRQECVAASQSAATTASPTSATTAAATTTTPTTTPTTVAATTVAATTVPTTVQPDVCPNSGCNTRRRRAAYDFLRDLRISGGTPVTSTCSYPGVVGVTATAPDGSILTVCTGALLSSTTIQIPSNCAETLNAQLATNDAAIVDGTSVPITSISSDTPLATATLSTPVDITAAPTLGCVYQSSMGAYDKKSCEIVGYGVDASGNQVTVPQTAKITFNSLACNGLSTTLTVPGASYGCAELDNAAACAGDGGALIMCNLVSFPTVKTIIGQAETFDCDLAKPAVYFQNFDV